MLFSWQNRTERGSKCLSLPSHLHPAPNVTGSHDSRIAAVAGRLWGHRRRVVATAIELAPNRCQQLPLVFLSREERPPPPLAPLRSGSHAVSDLPSETETKQKGRAVCPKA